MPWPKLMVVAWDLNRDKTGVERAFRDLQAWGVLGARYAGAGHQIIVRLGDGRETA